MEKKANPSCPHCRSNKTRKKGKTDHHKYQRYSCRECDRDFQETTSEARGEPIKFNNKLPASSTYVITAAQNATPANEPFLNSLLTYCKHNNAQLLIIPIRYKNPTSLWSKNQEHDEWWDEKLVPYLYAKRKKLNNNIEIMGDIKIQPTAVNPLAGMEGLSRGLSAVFAHPKLQLKTIPTPQNKLPCIMTTTGIVTQKNFTDTKAGKKGEFHMVTGAAVVELESREEFHLRQINALPDGSFIDWDKEYFPDGKIKKAGPPQLLFMGDTHYEHHEKSVDTAIFGKKGILRQLDPQNKTILFWNDLLDGYSMNPHHNGNPFISYAKNQSNMHLVRDEVFRTIKYLKSRTGKRKSVIVGSNHDDFLKRWLMTCDWRMDPANADFYLKTALAVLNDTHKDGGGTYVPDPFAYWVEKLNTEGHDIQCLRAGDSYVVGNVENGYHGHKGPNGARGTVKNLSQMGCKINSAHQHSPAIEGPHFKAGTGSRLKLEYSEDSPSSWLHSSILQYANGKRTLVNIINGRTRPKKK